MKITELHKVSKSKYGNLITHGALLQPHELKTVLYLNEFGLDIELMLPSYIPPSNNPDLEMLGTTWEMKSPRSYREDTIKKRFRKAKHQSDGHSIFDLRNITKDYTAVKNFLLKLFESTRGMKRLIMIEKDGRVFDYQK